MPLDKGWHLTVEDTAKGQTPQEETQFLNCNLIVFHLFIDWMFPVLELTT